MKLFMTRALLCTTALIAPIAAANAQTPGAPQDPPPWYSMDGNNVDLGGGSFNYMRTDISIGPSAKGLLATGPYNNVRADTGVWPTDGGLSYTESGGSLIWRRHSFDISVKQTPTGATVIFGNISDMFTLTNGAYVSTLGRASQLVSLGGGAWSYTAKNGTVVLFKQYHQANAQNTLYLAYQITAPNGIITLYDWTEYLVASGSVFTAVARLQGMTTNRGYGIKFDYGVNGVPTSADASDWQSIVAATAINTVTTPGCTFTQDASCSSLSGTRTVHYSLNPATGVVTITDPIGASSTYTYDAYNRPTNIRFPASTVDDYVVTYDSNGFVQTVTRPWGTWKYTFQYNAAANDVTNVDVASPTGITHSMEIDDRIKRPVYDVILNTNLPGTTYAYDGNIPGQLNHVTYPDGNGITYFYDKRGNITEFDHVSAFQSGVTTPPSIVTKSIYPASCTNGMTCNKPTQTIDALGRATDYVYNSDGSVKTVTFPAGANNVRPQAVYSYATINTGSTDFEVLTAISQCQSKATCAGSADEVVTRYDYTSNPNKLPVSFTKGSGDGTLTTATSYTYTDDGDVKLITGPISGQSTRYFYDGDRRTTLKIGPVPGSGLANRATQMVYNGSGQMTSLANGTASGQSDSAAQSFSALQTSSSNYVNGQLVSSTGFGGIGAKSFTYDAANRPRTTTLAMQGQGPDRVTTNAYSPVDGRLTSVTTGSASDTITVGYTYSPGGNKLSMTDGAGHKTGYGYDGFNRLIKISYPDPSSGSPSTTDFDAFTYDAASHVLTKKLRSVPQAFTYDALGNMLSKSSPSTTYKYDNLNKMLAATPGAGGGPAVTMIYDALGRMTSQTTGIQTRAYQYDLAGNRTRIAFGSNYVTYGYDLANEMTSIAPYGTGLISFTYDNLGRRTRLARVGGLNTDYTYDAASRMNTLAQLDVQFTFTRNPAGQILTRVVSNDSYSFNPVATDTSVTPNADYQIQSITGGSVAYTASANVLNSSIGGAPTWTYANDADRHLTGASRTGLAGTLTYDGLGRLATTNFGGSKTTYVYDGNALATEYGTSGTETASYIQGPNTDEPLIWYDVTSGQRRFLYADERGSVIASTDSTGAIVARQAYDAYGRGRASGTGGPGLLGRFGYTGQAWLPEAGLYHYKARAYDPNVGRFIQPDPSGIHGGINLYGYSLGDPINKTDTSGLEAFDLNQVYGDIGAGGGGIFGGPFGYGSYTDTTTITTDETTTTTTYDDGSQLIETDTTTTTVDITVITTADTGLAGSIANSLGYSSPAALGRDVSQFGSNVQDYSTFLGGLAGISLLLGQPEVAVPAGAAAGIGGGIGAVANRLGAALQQ